MRQGRASNGYMLVTAALLLAVPALAALRPDDFATRLWNALPTKAGNVVVSPTSLEAALGLLIDGVGPTSRPALAETFGIAPSGLQAYDGALQARLRALAGDEVTVSNAGFFASPPAPAYAAAVQRGYGATAERLRDAAQVNGWVDGHTKGRIPRLLDRLPPGTTALLVNAVTFDGDWTAPFDAARTRKVAFAGRGPVDTMHRSGHLAYAKGEGYGLVAIPYRGGRYRMVVLLPDAGDPAATLRGGAWRGALGSATEALVDLALPRFTVRSEPAVETAAKALGLAPLFRSMDFRPAVPGGAVAWIDRIVQKTYVKVDEKGTKAAAATGIVMTRGMRRPEAPVTFHVDRPFAFVIQHVASGEPLFMGVIREP